MFVDKQSDLSTWLLGKPADCTLSVSLDGLDKGKYEWRMALVDTTKGNRPGLEIAVDAALLDGGWLKVKEVTIR